MAQLNAMDRASAVGELMRCCGCARWAGLVADARPFASREALDLAADQAFDALGEADWREAFSHHPRIGERTLERAAPTGTGEWSRREQSGMASASEAVGRELVTGNQEYEARFGHVFLICATGRSADEMLGALRARLNNDAATELRIAAGQQRLITALRIGKMLGP